MNTILDQPEGPISKAVKSDVKTIEKGIGLFLDPMHIILIVGLGLALVVGTYLYESREARVSDAKTAAIAQQYANDKQAQAVIDAKNAQIQQQNLLTQQQLEAANTTLKAANQQLKIANDQLSAALAAQKTADATLPPTDQAARWQTLEPRATVTATSTGFAIDAAGGLATLQDLEELPADRAQITNLTSQLDNETKIATNDETALTSEKKAHATDRADADARLKTANDATNLCQAQFTSYKHHAITRLIKDIGIALGVGFELGTRYGK